MICIDSLSIAIKARNLNHSDIARLSGVSRQAVSLWFKSARDGFAEVKSAHLLRLCTALGVDAADLAQPLPDLGERRAAIRAALLWDRLYPDLEDFAAAVQRREPKALARLVEAYGLYGAAKAAGRVVWSRFPDYMKFLPPGRRQDLERVWRLHLAPMPR